MTQRFFSITATILALPAIILSILALSCAKANTGLAIDSATLLVTILSILVTILIGWQIYNVLSIEQRIDRRIDDEITKIKNDYSLIEKRNNEHISNINKSLSNDIKKQGEEVFFTMTITMVERLIHMDDYPLAAAFLYNSLDVSIQLKDKVKIDICLDLIMSVFKYLHVKQYDKLNNEIEEISKQIKQATSISDKASDVLLSINKMIK